MHFVLCRFVRIPEDMSLLSFLQILTQLEEPPHLTAGSHTRFIHENGDASLAAFVAICFGAPILFTFPGSSRIMVLAV